MSSTGRGGRSSPAPYGHSTTDIPVSSELGEAEEASFDEVDMQEVDEAGSADGEEEEEGEDLFGGNFLSDYRARPQEDFYDATGIDIEEDFEEITAEQRRAAEEAMEKRDRRRGRRLMALDEESDDGEGGRRRRRRRPHAEEDDEEDIMEDDVERDVEVDLVDRKNIPMREFLCQTQVQRTVAAIFRKFLTQFVDPETKSSVYMDKIRRMCADNKTSLVVSYHDLCSVRDCAMIAVYLADAPTEILKIFDEVATNIVLKTFRDYTEIVGSINVRISHLPLQESLRDIRQLHLNALLKVGGVVTRRTGVLPQLKLIKFDCLKCNKVLGPFVQEQGQKEVKLNTCLECQSRGPFAVNMEQTVYQNYQRLVLQESPGTVPPGRLPRQKTVVLTNDLVDCCKPGDEIEVTGIYRNNFDVDLNRQQGFPVFTTVIVANYVTKSELGSNALTEEDMAECRALGKDPNIVHKIVNSIAPSIYGREDIKLAVALAMFGGQAKEMKNQKHRVRGDINVLVVGDPGTAKSQILKYVEKTAPRCVYTTGQGATAVGLTASVHRDPVTREWTLEGGALVLADRGVCLIDEFDKMNDQDRTSIHEAMEQQTISISKAGIVTTLHARCSVIAAANPRGNMYDSTVTFSNNVDLSDPILSRFDVLCVVQDRVDPEEDMRTATFVTRSHVLHHPANRKELEELEKDQNSNEVNENRITHAMLKKYIRYCRLEVEPKLQNIDIDKLTAVYTELRRQSLATNSVPITVRHLESMIRLSEAFARIHLRDYVNESDVNNAISVAVQSFIATQKASVKHQLAKRLRKFTLAKDNPWTEKAKA